MKKSHLILLVINLALIAGLGVCFLIRKNYEFIIYVGVIIFFLGLVGFTINKVDYSLDALVGLTIWSTLHLAGGVIRVGDGTLYGVILVPLFRTYPVLRYDQFVHIFGFGVATLVMYCLLKRPLGRTFRNPVALSIVILMAGLGAGALNEVVEFVVTIVVPNSGVGGYQNTALDLCSNLVGAILALFYIHIRHVKRMAIPSSGND